MKFEFSKSGTPFIQLDAGKLIFSKSTADPIKGYKYICYCGTETTSVCVSSARAKNKKYHKITEDINFTVRLKDFRRDNKKAFPRKVKVISKISLNFIKNLITKNVIDEHLPFDVIPYIKDQVNIDDETDTWNDDPDLDEENELDDFEPATKTVLAKGRGKRKKSLKIKRNVTFKNVSPGKKGK